MSPTDRQRQKRLDAAFGEWVRERLAARKPDKWTQQRLRDELEQRGVQVKREWINQVINGEHASDDLRDAIELILGRFPDPAALEPISAGLTEAISDLVREMRADREGAEARLRGLELSVALLARQLGVELPEQSAPRETVG